MYRISTKNSLKKVIKPKILCYFQVSVSRAGLGGQGRETSFKSVMPSYYRNALQFLMQAHFPIC